MLRAVSAVPVIVATARDDDDSVVQALDAGADDYVLKPFQAGQLEARIRAVLRRAAGAPTPRPRPITVADLTVDPRSRRVTLAGAAGRAVARRSSTCWPTSPRGRARSSPSGSCSARCGSCPTAARTRPSTSTCRGCAASSGETRRGAAAAADRPRRRRPAGRARAVRRQITLLVAATTSVVLLAFLLPAASLVARVAEARALDAAAGAAAVPDRPPSASTTASRSTAEPDRHLGRPDGRPCAGPTAPGSATVGDPGRRRAPGEPDDGRGRRTGRGWSSPSGGPTGRRSIEVFVPAERAARGRDPHLAGARRARRRPAAAGAGRGRPAGPVADPARSPTWRRPRTGSAAAT